jgi:class 3 adenylate cyclase
MDVSDPFGAGSPAVERKLVAVLVCAVDVPSAFRLEHALEGDDPVAGYPGWIEAEVARHGGMVVEVLGDMLVAVFGVPRAHEDDPERAVRTALAVRAALAGPGRDDAAQLRAGIAAGEALIRLHEPATSLPPEVTGEVVTAAIAVMHATPPGAVLVTAATLRATERAISYAPAQLLPLAGASEPVAVWEALAPRPRSGRSPSSVLGVGLVGREGELAVLVDRYQRMRESRRPQLVTLVGTAGIGKSRLLAELRQRVAGEHEPPTWRASRAQPHAQGGSFGALVELVKAEAGILDSDQAAITERKLTDAVARVVASPAAGWITQQLRPLVGVSAGAALEVRGEVERQDVVAAWR